MMMVYDDFKLDTSCTIHHITTVTDKTTGEPGQVTAHQHILPALHCKSHIGTTDEKTEHW